MQNTLHKQHKTVFSKADIKTKKTKLQDNYIQKINYTD
jgi:hypothetical protein